MPIEITLLQKKIKKSEEFNLCILTKHHLFVIIGGALIKQQKRDVAQLVARVLWEHDAAGSSPVISTKSQRVIFALWDFIGFE